mmetsp:Transcript_113453/g.219810  ORF Transcript_113453/g.219810 Transcript_113453/m.219810 type:complete len:101 (-) Transcript_113453:445-747(-)
MHFQLRTDRSELVFASKVNDILPFDQLLHGVSVRLTCLVPFFFPAPNSEIIQVLKKPICQFELRRFFIIVAKKWRTTSSDVLHVSPQCVQLKGQQAFQIF